MLVYRRDAFESDSNRAAAQQAGLNVPPFIWTQLDAIAKFFQGRDWDGDGQPDDPAITYFDVAPDGTYHGRVPKTGNLFVRAEVKNVGRFRRLPLP